jgi:hypothetical protein
MPENAHAAAGSNGGDTAVWRATGSCFAWTIPTANWIGGGCPRKGLLQGPDTFLSGILRLTASIKSLNICSVLLSVNWSVYLGVYLRFVRYFRLTFLPNNNHRDFKWCTLVFCREKTLFLINVWITLWFFKNWVMF